MTATISPPRVTDVDLAALLKEAIAAWAVVDLTMALGPASAIRGAEAEFRAAALAYHEAKKAWDRQQLEAEYDG